MMETLVALLVAPPLVGGFINYLQLNKNDRESRKIYSVVTAAGAVIIAFVVVRILVAGF